MTDALPEQLLDYFAKREAARSDRIRAFLDSLTARERALVKDAAIMGYVQGAMHPKGERIPKDSQTLATVVDACFAHPDLYPAVALIERHPGFPDDCPNLVTIQPDPPRHGGGVRCGCHDEPEDD